MLTRGGRRIALIEPLPRHKAVARVATIRYAPNRVLDGLKTLSYAGNMLATRIAKEGGFDEALLVSPHGRVLEGLDVVVLLGPRRRAAARRRWRTGSSARSRASGSSRRPDAVEEICTLDDLRGAEEAFIASTVRVVQPIAAIDELELPAAPGPVTLRTREAMDQAIERELGAPV